MSEDYMIRNCAPTLAGLKTGSIFTCPMESPEALRDFIRQMNQRLGPKGLRIIPLRYSENRALIYVYRPQKLSRDLARQEATQLLRCRGYNPESCQQCVVHLIKKLRAGAEFPHEIGLFLGYPPEDVNGFIENKAGCCKCVGTWKVYGEEAAARKRFAQYKKCTRIYREQWENGKNIERLTVAG